MRCSVVAAAAVDFAGKRDVQILTDRTNTIRASVKDVRSAGADQLAQVVMVNFLFLRSIAATMIPSVAVPLSIVGTFGVMYLRGTA